MRVDVGRAVSVHPGDVVWIRARLPKTESEFQARLSVWSRTKGYEFAPHVPIAAMGIVRDGKPEMVSPMRLTLDPNKPVRELSFVADEPLDIRVRQELDTSDEPHAKIKIKRYSLRTYRFIQWIKQHVFRAKGPVLK